MPPGVSLSNPESDSEADRNTPAPGVEDDGVSHAGHESHGDDGHDSDESLAGIREPTAQVPLLSGLRRDMLIALESYRGSYLGMCLMLDRLADDLEVNQSFIPVKMTIEALRSAERVYTLLHAIPADLLASIIRGTIAYDFLRSGYKPNQYSKKTGGTYVAALSVEGRRGKFLSRTEMAELAANIDKYVEAYDHFVGSGNKWDDQSGASRDFKRFIASVDSKHGSAQRDASPRFVRKPGHRESTTELAKMFRKRQSAATGPDEPQIQSPLMVGCNGAASTCIEDRVKAHYPRSGLVNTTRTWALTLCLMSYMDLTPIVTTVAVLPTWERKQLPRSERLVTALAQSLVTQDGFNIDQPGNRTDTRSPSALLGTKQVVMALRPWFCLNLRQSTVHMNRELELVKVVELLRESGPKPIPQAWTKRARRVIRDLQDVSHRVAENEKKLEKLLFDEESKNVERRKMEVLFDDVNKCLEEIYSGVKGRNDAGFIEEWDSIT